MDRAALIRALIRLTPADLETVLTFIPGAARQVSDTGTVAAKMTELIRWAESERGPGLRRVEEALGELGPLDPRVQSTCPCNLLFTTIGTLFKGRDEFLAGIRVILTRNDGRAIAVHGLGGVGKTRVALEYAWRHKSEYTALLFVSAPTASDLRANLARLVDVLAISTTTTAVDEQAAEVLKWLEAHPGWLLIVDNVDTAEAAREALKLLVKLGAGHVMITTRISNWPAGVEPRELSVLAENDALEFLLERTRNRPRRSDDGVQGALVARELGCLALALEQAGAYIDKLRLSFTDYLERWRQKRPDVLRWHDDGLMEYPASVAITWETSFAQLAEPEQRLLQVLAWLAPEPIPLFFFDAEPLTAAIPEPREALAGLAAFSLARFETEADTVVIHRLVQEVARGRGDETGRASSLRTALDAVDASATGDPQDVRSWPVWTPLAAHVTSVVSYADAEIIAEPTARLMSKLGLYHLNRGQFRGAEPLMRRALAVVEQSYAPDHPNVAVYLNNLAQLLQDTNRMAEAEPLMRRALAIDEQSYGANHPGVARDLNNLASLLQVTNRMAEVEPLMRRALAIDEQSYGKDHPDIAIDLNNLAQLLKATNRMPEAEPLMRRALAIDEQSYGKDHPSVARDLNNLAALLQATNRMAEAEPLYRRALSIDEQSYGKDHPSVAIRLNNLAQLLHASNRLDEAEPLMRRALAIDEQLYGANHPDVAICLNSLALLLQDTNRLAEAEPLSRRMLEIFVSFTRSTGHEHPHLRAAVRNYSRLLAAMGQSQEQIDAQIENLFRPSGVSQN
jgi:tetratricopeptide (TPR) repeat protein